MSDIPITGTLLLGMCWVCRSSDGLHEHHVVPQSCGGEHGPTVTLCAKHHNVIHTEAYHPSERRVFQGTPQQQYKLAYLAQVIYESFRSVQGQEKPVLKSFRFGVATQRKWAAFRATIPSASSDQAAMELAIEMLYATYVAPLNRRK